MPKGESESVRFWSKVIVGDCWTWKGTMMWKGYGVFFARGRQYRAHRYAYELMVAPIPKGLVVDHLCRNRACVNPTHLEPVTQKENVRRGQLVALKTHCAQGHDWNGTDAYTGTDGRKRCRICNRNYTRRARVKKKKKNLPSD